MNAIVFRDNGPRLLAAALAVACGGLLSGFAGGLATDNLTVTRNANVYGELCVRETLPIPTNGRILYFSLNQYNGSTVADDSGGGHIGTVYGAGFDTNGLAGSAYSFGGTGRLDVADAADLNDPTGFTFAVWYKPGNVDSFAIPLSKDGDNGYYIQCNAGWYSWYGTTFHVRFGSYSEWVGEGPLPVGEWCHLLLRFDGTTATFYKNGTVLGSPTACSAPAGMNQPLHVGAFSAATGFASGLIDEVMIYNRALEEAEILALAVAKPDVPRLNVQGAVRFEKGVDYVGKRGDVPMGTFTNQP